MLWHLLGKKLVVMDKQALMRFYLLFYVKDLDMQLDRVSVCRSGTGEFESSKLIYVQSVSCSTR
jgi:hypothetical protein